MNATQPTQGEWEAVEDEGTIYVEAPGATICMMMSGSPHNQDRVDAALICAAKDLREALQWCVDHFDGNTQCTAVQFNNCVDKCRDALAKANGDL